MYYCPNCRAQVAYGQPYCTYCNTVLIWQDAQTQGQYQNTPDQNGGQQQSWQQGSGEQQYGWNQQQQQWYQAPADSQTVASGQRKRLHKKINSQTKGLLQVIKDNRAIILKIAIPVIAIVAVMSIVIVLQGEITKVFTAPTVTSFESSSSQIALGQQASLEWDVTGVNEVSINPGIGNVPSAGTRKVSPASTTTYMLVASNIAGTVRKEVTLTVTGPLPSINSFSFNTDNIAAGQPATMTWNVSDADSVSIEPGVGQVQTMGSKEVSPNTTTTYTLTATNDVGNSTATAKITVSISNVPIISTFKADPASVSAGKATTLSWEVFGASSININQGIGGVSSKNSVVVKPLETTTYILTADNGYKSMTEEVTVTVDTSSITPTTTANEITTAPIIATFTLVPSAITLGDNTTLTWDVMGARSVSIIPGIGTVPSTGYAFLIPAGPTTYTLTAINSFGTETATASVTISTDPTGTLPVINAFNASPSTISAGGASTLTWDIAGATVITIDQGIGKPASNFSQPVYPTETTAYTLTAINSTGTDNMTVTVTVNP